MLVLHLNNKNELGSKLLSFVARSAELFPVGGSFYCCNQSLFSKSLRPPNSENDDRQDGEE